jgi:hypothetical protein
MYGDAPENATRSYRGDSIETGDPRWVGKRRISSRFRRDDFRRAVAEPHAIHRGG